MKKITHLLLVVSRQPDTAKFLSLSSGVTQPLGAGYIAGYLIKHGFNVAILDNDIERLDSKRFSLYLRNISPRYVGFSTFTNSFHNSLYFAYLVKEVDKDIKVIMGGAHASALPKDVLRNSVVDIVVKGEGEETMLELVRALDNGGNLSGIKGIAYKDSGEIIENPERELCEDIDKFSFPAYQLLPMNKYYLPASRRMGTGRAGSIITGRGCPYRCTFCSRAVFGRKLRLRGPESVAQEMKHLLVRYGIKEFLIWDDVFTIDEKRAIEICRLIRKENLNLIWSCSSRVDRASDSLYAELYSAGCREILFGVESGSQAIIDSLQKDADLSQVEKSVKLCKKHNIRAFCTFMLGSPLETKETLSQTLNFVKKIDPDYAIFCLLAPLPGSALFKEAVEDGRLELAKVNWNNFVSLLSTVPPPIRMGDLEKRELVRWQRKIFREFYLRPKYIIRHLKNLSSLAHIYESARGFVALLGHQLHRFHFEE